MLFSLKLFLLSTLAFHNRPKGREAVTSRHSVVATNIKVVAHISDAVGEPLMDESKRL